MKKFFFDTIIGTTITMIGIIVLSITLSIMITLVTFGIGLISLNYILVNNPTTLEITISIWTMLHIIMFLLVTWIIFYKILYFGDYSVTDKESNKDCKVIK